jgi:hypothetical protein
MDLQDNADSDMASTQITAYDPWKYLYRRPVLIDDGGLPGARGTEYFGGVRPDQIITQQLLLAETYGTSTFIDWGQAAGGGFYNGVIENITEIDAVEDGLALSFPPTTSLGEMLDTIAALGTCDIVLDPIYDPINRPGYLAELSLLNHRGEFRPEAVLGWDQWPRNVVSLSRQIDGTERGNRMKFYASNNLVISLPIEDTDSITKYGDYWSMQSFPGFPSIANAQLIGYHQLTLLANGQETFQVGLAAERAPMYKGEYDLGDTLPIYASQRFRQTIPGTEVRVESIPITIGDDDQERIDSLVVTTELEPGT